MHLTHANQCSNLGKTRIQRQINRLDTRQSDGSPANPKKSRNAANTHHYTRKNESVCLQRIGISNSPSLYFVFGALTADTIQEATDDTPRAIVFHTRKPTEENEPASSTSPVNVCTTSKLISVAEILKREYIKLLESKHLQRLIGLYQYNFIGAVADKGADPDIGANIDEEDARRRDILNALDGKNL